MFCRNSFDGNDTAYWSYMTNKLYKKVGAPDVTLAYDAQGNLLQSGALSTPVLSKHSCLLDSVGPGNKVSTGRELGDVLEL